MFKILLNTWALRIAGIFLGGIFAYAGFLKLQDPLKFADSITTFQVLPPHLINIVALTLPPLELLAGVMMVVGIKKREASFGILLLSLIFLLAVGQGIVRGLSLDCGCFGGSSSPNQVWITFFRDLSLVVGATWLYCAYAKRLTLNERRPLSDGTYIAPDM